MSKVTFLGIGAQKCASTWIYDILSDHPEVCLSREKELHYFSKWFARGFEWYDSNFDHCDDSKQIGEISPSYFHESDVPGRIKRYNPDMKIVLTLRNPVDRAYSNHVHNVRHGYVKHDYLFESSLIRNPMYIEQGMYATHIKKWLEYFGKEQFLIIIFDDVVSDPVGVSKRLYEFLGVESSNKSIAISKASNVSNAFRNIEVARSVDKVRELTHRSGLEPLWNIAKKVGIKKLYRKLNEVSVKNVIPPMEHSTKQYLVEKYASEIVELEKIVGRSLDQWR